MKSIKHPSEDMAGFSGAVREWFSGRFERPTEVQARTWELVADGENVLAIAPTGSGKTLAAFLWAIDALTSREAGPAGGGVRVLYVSPLKALAVDVDYNLTFFAICHGVPVGIYEVDVIERAFLSHRARARLYPRICAHGEGCFGLAEALHKREACECLPILEHRWVEGLAGYGAVTQGREVVFTYVFAYEEAEYGRRRAE